METDSGSPRRVGSDSVDVGVDTRWRTGGTDGPADAVPRDRAASAGDSSAHAPSDPALRFKRSARRLTTRSRSKVFSGTESRHATPSTSGPGAIASGSEIGSARNVAKANPKLSSPPSRRNVCSAIAPRPVTSTATPVSSYVSRPAAGQQRRRVRRRGRTGRRRSRSGRSCDGRRRSERRGRRP